MINALVCLCAFLGACIGVVVAIVALYAAGAKAGSWWHENVQVNKRG